MDCFAERGDHQAGKSMTEALLRGVIWLTDFNLRTETEAVIG